jgi:hypothetical protein
MATGKNPFSTIIYTSCLIICKFERNLPDNLGGVDATRFRGLTDGRTYECNSICLSLLGGINITFNTKRTIAGLEFLIFLQLFPVFIKIQTHTINIVLITK